MSTVEKKAFEDTLLYSDHSINGTQVIPVIRQVGNTVRSLELYQRFAVRNLLSSLQRSRNYSPEGEQDRILSNHLLDALLVIEQKGEEYSPFSEKGLNLLRGKYSPDPDRSCYTIIQAEDSNKVLRLFFHNPHENPVYVKKILGFQSHPGCSRPNALLYVHPTGISDFTREIMPDGSFRPLS